MWYVIKDDELYHHGIKGQRWGVRRFQNPDGTLTAAGKKRYDYDIDTAKNRLKDASTVYRYAKKHGSRQEVGLAKLEKQFAKQDLQSERAKKKINNLLWESNGRKKLISKNMEYGMSKEEAEIDAQKQISNIKKCVATTLLTLNAPVTIITFPSPANKRRRKAASDYVKKVREHNPNDIRTYTEIVRDAMRENVAAGT